MQTKLKNKLKNIIKSREFLYTKYDEGLYFGRSNFCDLKGKFSGKRVFIVGNGPSLNKHDLSFLKNEYSFAVNGIFYKTASEDYKPTFYVVEDRHVMQDNLKEINDYDIEYKFFPVDYKRFIKKKKNTRFFRLDKGYYNSSSPYFAVPRFSCDVNHKVYCGQSVTMVNLQLAAYLGFSEVYLIGMDHSYVIPEDASVNGEEILSNSDDPNHFHPSYFGKGKKWHDPHLDRVERTYNYFKLVYEAQGRTLKNATIGGSLEVFERVDYDSLFLKK